MRRASFHRCLLPILCAALVACDSGGSSGGGSGETFRLGGTVSGMTGSLTLVNAGQPVTVSANGSFQFAQALPDGSPYHVMVSTAPTDQSCTITNASGSIAGAQVHNVQVLCVSRQYTIGGTVSGLSGTLLLQNNNTDNLSISANGTFTFATSVTAGTAYRVAVQNQPATQTCTVSNSSGTATGGNINGVTINCVNNTTPYTISGTVSGLTGSLVLQNNGGNNLTINANGAFTFSSPMNTGSAYQVGLLAQPAGQDCTVSNGSGTALADITNVSVVCTPRLYTVRGYVSGLTGRLELQNNGSDTSVRLGNGSFSFPTLVAHGAAYNVIVTSQPAGQVCVISNGSGTIAAAGVNVAIDCGPIRYSVSYNVSGLTGGTLELANNGGPDNVTANGNYTFTTLVDHGTAYAITVVRQPTGQTCSVGNSTGSNTVANVTGINVICSFIANLSFGNPQQLIFSWLNPNTDTPGGPATTFRVYKDADGHSGYTPISGELTGLSFSEKISVHLHDWINARYLVRACKSGACSDTAPIYTAPVMLRTIGYFKASNADQLDAFGHAVALSADGNTMIVSAPRESSNATGINFESTDQTLGQGNNLAPDAGAVYVFVRNDTRWTQQAWIKASNTNAGDLFGRALALSADGNLLAVGAPGEDSTATGIDGNQDSNTAAAAGAVYLFKRSGNTWSQHAYIKASNTEAGDNFGEALALSGDGTTLAVGAPSEDSAATGINGAGNDNAAPRSGAVYVFAQNAGTWSEQAYIKASNTGSNDLFGQSVALSADGSTLAAGATGESSSAVGINGDQGNNAASESGAAFVFSRNAGNWSQQAYIKASNTGANDDFGYALALSADGDTLIAGAPGESSNASDPGNNDVSRSGAAYSFARNTGNWSQQALIKAYTPDADDAFGSRLALASDGSVLSITAPGEDSSSKGVVGDVNDNSASDAGAAFVYVRDTSGWMLKQFLKASNTEADDSFGASVAVSADGSSMVVGASLEDGLFFGLNSEFQGNYFTDSGAAYLY